MLVAGFVVALCAGLSTSLQAAVPGLVGGFSHGTKSSHAAQLARVGPSPRPEGWEAAQALPGKDGSATTPVIAPAIQIATQIAVGTGDARSLGRSLNAVEFGDQHWPALLALWNRESNWNPSARNGGSGACGIPQALPCSKIPDMSPQGQIEWGLGYIRQRYGNPSAAWAFWQSRHWY